MLTSPPSVCVEQVGDSVLKCRELDCAGLQPLAPSKSEQPLDELAALLGGTLGHRQHLALIVGELRAFVEQAQAADHRRQQIVEVVCDAARELADCVHFLRMDELALERSLLADVRQSARQLEGLSVGIFQQHGLIEKMLVASVGRHPAILDRRTAALPPG